MNNDEQKSKRVFWHGLLIWLLATLFYFFDNLLNVSPGAMKPELSEAFARSAASLGILSSCYLWAYGLMQIPAGLLMDSVGPRKLLSIASLFCAAGSWLFGIAETLDIAMLGRLLIGVGASTAVVGCTKIASVWFVSKRFALFVGLMVSVGMSGAAFGASTVSWIVQVMGWRESMQWGALMAIGLSIFMWFIIRDKPSVTIVEMVQPEEQIGLWQSLVEVTSCKQAWVASIFAGLMFVPTLAFGALWGTPFLVEAHGFTRDQAGALVALIFIGWVFGGPLYGWISDLIQKRNLPMYFSNITTLIVCLILIYYTDRLSVFGISLLMFLLGFFSSGFILAFAVMREKNRPAIAGTAIGFINMLNTFGGAFFQYLIGRILDLTAKDVIVPAAGKKIFSLNDYQTALLSLPICLIISLMTLVFLKETRCQPVLALK